MKSKNIALLIITSGLAAFMSACSTGKTKGTNIEEKVSAPPVVEVISPLPDQPLYPLSLPGELKPFEQVDIFAKAKGFVKRLYADSKVTKGQLLAILEAPE